MVRLTWLGALLAALFGLAGAAGAVEEEFLPMRGGDGAGAFRVNSFQRAGRTSDAWAGNDAKPEELPKIPPVPGFFKWKNACQRRPYPGQAGFSPGGGDFREVTPYLGPIPPEAGIGWLEALLPLVAAPFEDRREPGRRFH